ncbi:MAG: glycoside hydrolase family 18 protein [Lachnospiraceae bacterium]|nr:glycoside hydrolase family 18 protein [Lachnospiraceae bacterium]
MKKTFYISCIALISSLTTFSVFNPLKAVASNEKKLNVYYTSWAVYGNDYQTQHVRDLPWDRLSTINHSFWRIKPNEDLTEFPIVSADEWADLGRNMCFDQYEEMTALYPNVDVLLAIGGWSDTKWFAEMASTETGRKSFIDSCIETMIKYPFLSGIDIDWEYPGTSRNYEGEGFIGSSADKDNFTALMKEMREAFDTADMTEKIITYCAPAGTGRLKSGEVCIDFAAVEPFVDRVNLMTYDMSGSWSKNAFHHSPLYPSKAVEFGASASEVVEYLISLGVTPSKINIGSPLYSQGFRVDAENGEAALGQKISGTAHGNLANGQFRWFDLNRMESAEGWEALYDEEAASAYLFNNDPESIFYQHFYTYESPRSLQAKLDYINEMGLGGLIVWETAGDPMDLDYPMLTQMARELGIFKDERTEFIEAAIITDIDEPSISDENADHQENYPFSSFLILIISLSLLLIIIVLLIIAKSRNSKTNF